MQFLVYLMVLLGAISTVLLEVHWLTSPAPQPKPTVQAGAPRPAPKVEGPNAALSPVYPKKFDAPRPLQTDSQAQTTEADAPGDWPDPACNEHACAASSADHHGPARAAT
jgi:hypothetical protein